MKISGISRESLTLKNAIKSAAGFNRFLPSALMVGCILAVALMPELVMAEPWDDAATKVQDIFTGGFARTLAIIAVIACGVMALAGKLSWDWAIKIILGIVLIFGAATIVDYFGATGG